jgi:hypothetical protein
VNEVILIADAPDGILYEAVKKYVCFGTQSALSFDDKIYEALSSENVNSQYFYTDLL